MKCDRCGKDTISVICSMFNTEDICDECQIKEKAHPKYKRARQAEENAVKAGNFNFIGIGKPSDL
jgi:hypothetical protein